MDFESLGFIDMAASIATSGRWEAVNAKVKELAANPGVDNAWYVQLFGSLCCEIFSEYQALKRAHEETREDNVSLLAWRARSLLELSVWSMYCSKSRENARRVYEDAGRDVLGVFDNFTKWGSTAGQAADWLESLERAKQDLSQRAASEGIESLDGSYKQVKEAAKECGIARQFSVSYKTLSKFAHPTSMRILALQIK